MSDEAFLQYQVAGTTISLKEDEAALVIYADRKLLGEVIEYEYYNGLLTERGTLSIVERNVGGTPTCATILPRIKIWSSLTTLNIEIRTPGIKGSSAKSFTATRSNITEVYLKG